MNNSARKVLIIVENLPVPFDTRVWQEATTLKDNGYTVSVICPKSPQFSSDYELLQGVHIFRHNLPKEGNGFIGYVREYFFALKEEFRLTKKVYREIGFDVIHGCNPPDNIFLIARKYKKKGVSYVFDHHDICPELFVAKFGRKGLLYKIMLFLEKQNYRHADVAFSTNESYKKIAIERGKKAEEDVFVLRSGPRLERMKIKPPVKEIKRGRKHMVGYVGVIGKQEGLDYLLEAARYIKHTKKRNDVFFGICGSGPYLETLKERLKALDLEDMVAFTGRVSDEVLLDYLNTADVCVNPDEYNEMNDKSTMNKVLEYMALGKPIVQFDLTEGRYSAADASLYAKNNDAVDMAKKILKLLDNEALRKRMGETGRRRVLNELSWDLTKTALLRGYDHVYAKKLVVSNQIEKRRMGHVGNV